MHKTNPPKNRRFAAVTLFAAAVLALAVPACSSGTSTAKDGPATDGSPSSGATTGPGEPAAESGSDAARDAYDLKLAQCLRDRGIPVADPQPGMGIQESGPEVDAAASDCMAELGPPPTHDWTEAELETLDERNLAMAECLRGLGHQVADPKDHIIALDNVSDADLATCNK